MNDRKHLTAREVERLITATRGSRTELFYDTRKVAVFDQSSGANLRL